MPLGGGCDPAKQNLYEWSAGSGLTLVNAAPGATLAAQAGAISADGSRIYFTNSNDGNLYLRDAGQLKQVDGDGGGGGTFQTASSDGATAYFTKGGQALALRGRHRLGHRPHPGRRGRRNAQCLW